MTAKKYKTEEERKEANREAQRRFAGTEKGKKYNLEKAKKWAKKKRKTDPEYFKKFQKNRKEYFREYQIKLRKENPEKVRKLAREAQRRFARTAKGKKYNLERVKKWAKKKRKTNPEYFKRWQKNRASYFKVYQAKLRKKNPEKTRVAGRKGAKRFYQKTKRHPKYIILRALRRRLSETIRKVGANKKASTMEILGCTAEDFKNYLENKFREGMIWENYGTWHIDHINPCYSFNLTKDEEQKRCFHYTNLQPLWARENLIKGKKINYENKAI